jgi:hypothetical protein
MSALPDCACCDAVASLTAVRVEPRGVRVCFCTVCAKTCRVNAAGAIIHLPDVRDISGNVMYEP